MKSGDVVGEAVEGAPFRMPFKWEMVAEITHGSFWTGQQKETIARARVPGGWVVRTGLGIRVSTCYVPDPGWRWQP